MSSKTKGEYKSFRVRSRESQTILNWISNQTNFSDSVRLLIVKAVDTFGEGDLKERLFLDATKFIHLDGPISVPDIKEAPHKNEPLLEIKEDIQAETKLEVIENLTSEETLRRIMEEELEYSRSLRRRSVG